MKTSIAVEAVNVTVRKNEHNCLDMRRVGVGTAVSEIVNYTEQ